LLTNALETVFQQMRIARNRQRTIESYEYIFLRLVSINKLEYVEDITAESIYHYLDSIQVTLATKLIDLKTTKAVISKFYNSD